jgi:hypothetical protein
VGGGERESCAVWKKLIYLSSIVHSLCFHSTLPPSLPPSLSLTHTRARTHTHALHIPHTNTRKEIKEEEGLFLLPILSFSSQVSSLSLSLNFFFFYKKKYSFCFFLYINLSLNVNRETALNFDQCDYPFSFFIAFSLWLPCFSLF